MFMWLGYHPSIRAYQAWSYLKWFYLVRLSPSSKPIFWIPTSCVTPQLCFQVYCSWNLELFRGYIQLGACILSSILTHFNSADVHLFLFSMQTLLLPLPVMIVTFDIYCILLFPFLTASPLSRCMNARPPHPPPTHTHLTQVPVVWALWSISYLFLKQVRIHLELPLYSLFFAARSLFL